MGTIDDHHTKERLEHRGLRLEYATIGWNAAEMLISIGLGVAARSLALIAFGLDTMVELFASGVVVWHLRHPGRDSDRVTARALRLVAASFFVLTLVVTVGSVWALASGAAPDESPLGIAYLALTAIVMLSLGRAKRTTGMKLGSEPLVAEARMSVIDAALAAGVLVGLTANVLFGWWWADPVAALVVAGAAAHEGFENLEEAAELLEGDD
ncbi:MAG: cation transporter [Actinomycetota bacterium]